MGEALSEFGSEPAFFEALVSREEDEEDQEEDDV